MSRTFNRPFFWPDGNGSFDVYYWQCGCDGSGTSTIPSSGTYEPTFNSDNGSTSSELSFLSDSGNTYTDIIEVMD